MDPQDNLPIAEEEPQLNNRKRRRPELTDFEKIECVEDFKRSAKSMRQYCKDTEKSHSTFCGWVKDYDMGKMVAGTCNGWRRHRAGSYLPVEQKLVEYIVLRGELYQADALSWQLLQCTALELASKYLSPEEAAGFKASPGWLQRVLRRNNLKTIRLQDEAMHNTLTNATMN